MNFQIKHPVLVFVQRFWIFLSEGHCCFSFRNSQLLELHCNFYEIEIYITFSIFYVLTYILHKKVGRHLSKIVHHMHSALYLAVWILDLGKMPSAARSDKPASASVLSEDHFRKWFLSDLTSFAPFSETNCQPWIISLGESSWPEFSSIFLKDCLQPLYKFEDSQWLLRDIQFKYPHKHAYR